MGSFSWFSEWLTAWPELTSDHLRTMGWRSFLIPLLTWSAVNRRPFIWHAVGFVNITDNLE